MKNFIISVALLAGVVTTFNSCKEEPDPIPAIVGTWTRQEYELADVPSAFSSWDGLTQTSVINGETGYTFVFKADGTYTRSFSPYVNDQGPWTLVGDNLTVSPDDIDDLNDIEGSPIGLEFNVEGEITNLRMVLSRPETFILCSDASIAAAGGDVNAVPDDQWVEVDVTLLYKFNKLN